MYIVIFLTLLHQFFSQQPTVIKKLVFLLLAVIAVPFFAIAKNGEDSHLLANIKQLKLMDSVTNAMKWQTGAINLEGSFVKLNVPEGFKYLNTTQSKYVLTEVWGNPPREDVLGMLFPESGGPFADSSYAFVVSYEAIGYVKDGDAADINYDDLLKEMQKEEVETNKERAKQGYETVHIVGWASKPFYDPTHKILHWAKNIKFGNAEDNTLNYEVRVLGRKGVFSMNAVASMSELNLVKADIDKILKIASFSDGYAYKDFDSNIDEVAAWTIGGLVAGKVLLKAGFWAMILKGWKLIAIGLVAVGAFIKKFFFGKKTEETNETPTA
jgi:uncharacterized membrane-anchored protein